MSKDFSLPFFCNRSLKLEHKRRLRNGLGSLNKKNLERWQRLGFPKFLECDICRAYPFIDAVKADGYDGYEWGYWTKLKEGVVILRKKYKGEWTYYVCRAKFRFGVRGDTFEYGYNYSDGFYINGENASAWRDLTLSPKSAPDIRSDRLVYAQFQYRPGITVRFGTERKDWVYIRGYSANSRGDIVHVAWRYDFPLTTPCLLDAIERLTTRILYEKELSTKRESDILARSR